MPENRELGDSVDVEGMREALESRPVEFALLFGSHARGESEAASDIDIALRFPESMDDREQFRQRNRIDAALQEFAPGFVDVSDIDTLPLPVAYAAVTEGILIVGDEEVAEAYRTEIEAEYESTAERREQDREAFIDRLARGDI